MQALILAAGLGARLGELTRSSTKCMVRVNDRPLIDYTLEAAEMAGVQRVIMVLGHGGEEVREVLGDCQRGIPIEYVENPQYRESNNIYSLFLAREHLAVDDTLVIESDVLFDPTVLVDCVTHPAADLAVVAQYEPWMDGTVTLVDPHGRILRFMGKDEFRWADQHQYFKTVNIYKLSRSFSAERFVPFLETYLKLTGQNAFYEEVLRVLVFMGADIEALPIGNKLWYEIDDVQDLDIASTLFADPSTRTTRIQQRFGGYWRFPRLKDFCYLVNPYFPPQRMLDEIGSSLTQLLTQYPSGARVQRLLAARLMRCEPASIAVGNGASELISSLMAELDGKQRIGVTVPTFEEYLRTVDPSCRVALPASGPDLRYSTDELARFATEERLGALVVVNPNNPSGQVLSRSELVGLAEALREAGTRLILDESFVDFVDGTADHTLVKQDILARFPDMIVLKSISKSYGVPGLRLGVLVSHDRELVDRLCERLSVWNINSVAECFLQIIGKYESDYAAACRQVVEERQRMFSLLQDLHLVRPIPSGGNYLLCELAPSWDGERLARRLLEERWVLIKDCSHKAGFDGRSYIRLAVRSREDVDYLVGSLQELEQEAMRT